jgi:hypothetical protein
MFQQNKKKITTAIAVLAYILELFHFKQQNVWNFKNSN